MRSAPAHVDATLVTSSDGNSAWFKRDWVTTLNTKSRRVSNKNINIFWCWKYIRKTSIFLFDERFDSTNQTN